MNNIFFKNSLTLKSFAYDKSSNSFIIQDKNLKVDIEELLDIAFTLENNFIPYRITQDFEIFLLKKRV